MIDIKQYRGFQLTFCLLLSFLLLAIGIMSIEVHPLPLKVMSLTVGFILLSSTIYHMTHTHITVSWPLEIPMIMASIIGNVVIFSVNQEATPFWVYTVCVITVLFLPFKRALLAAAALSVVVIIMTLHMFSLFEHMQIFSAYFTLLGFALGFALLNHINIKRLQPLVAIDPITGAYNSQQLNKILQKEIQRAEREGSALSLVTMNITNYNQFCHLLQLHNRRRLLKRISRTLKTKLRIFDSYFRSRGEFSIILPYCMSSEAQQLTNSLLDELYQDHKPQAQIKAGIASLNVGDTPDTLRAASHQALQKAQQMNHTSMHSCTNTDDSTESAANAHSA